MLLEDRSPQLLAPAQVAGPGGDARLAALRLDIAGCGGGDGLVHHRCGVVLTVPRQDARQSEAGVEVIGVTGDQGVVDGNGPREPPTPREHPGLVANDVAVTGGHRRQLFIGGGLLELAAPRSEFGACAQRRQVSGMTFEDRVERRDRLVVPPRPGQHPRPIDPGVEIVRFQADEAVQQGEGLLEPLRPGVDQPQPVERARVGGVVLQPHRVQSRRRLVVAAVPRRLRRFLRRRHPAGADDQCAGEEEPESSPPGPLWSPLPPPGGRWTDQPGSPCRRPAHGGMGWFHILIQAMHLQAGDQRSVASVGD